MNAFAPVCQQTLALPVAVQAAQPEPVQTAGRVCLFCGKAFVPWPTATKKLYCSKTCKAKWFGRIKKAKARLNRPLVQCGFCGIKFSAKRSLKRQYCSHSCRAQAWNRIRRAEAAARHDPTPRKCGQCGDDFSPGIYDRLRSPRRFCSKKCSHVAWVAKLRESGKYVSSYTKLRLRAMEKLGAKCAWCGFSEHYALQIDHVNGNGWAERIHGRRNEYRFLSRVIKDTSGEYQCLCANCNWKKRWLNRENFMFLNRSPRPVSQPGA